MNKCPNIRLIPTLRECYWNSVIFWNQFEWDQTRIHLESNKIPLDKQAKFMFLGVSSDYIFLNQMNDMQIK